ncbi:MAG TPA: hypothetical protein VKU77_03880 [Streptosporangiaceae bacterium]|nr:hypothetical protein [Streptosporangiaceae bacterium]
MGGTTGGTWRIASSATAAAVAGAVLLALEIAEPPLAGLARQSVNASNGSVPVWFSAAFALVGFVVARRRPRNPLGWVIMALAGFFALSEDASFYVVADYRLRHGGLPLGWVALLAQLGWAPGIVLSGLTVLLFPDGRLPARRLRWVIWPYLGVAALWMVGTVIVTIGAIAAHRTSVDSGGNLLLLDRPAGFAAWWGVVNALFFPLLALGWLVSVAAQALSYRRASGERRQQLKWLLAGSVLGGASLAVTAQNVLGSSVAARIVAGVAFLGILAIPVSIGVAVMKYRLYDIDRVISRTLAYAIVTGLLVGVYAGLVLLATGVLRLHSSVAVAAATLAAAALFAPVRRRVQRAVDRRFNRARYDADQMVAAFAGRLKDAVHLDTVRDDLAHVVTKALEPAHIRVWVKPG